MEGTYNMPKGIYMDIDYNLYKIFLYLFEEKSISKTANKLYVSQPAISYSLKELERQLGYTLFYRNSKGIEPTTEAKELYNYISMAFNILQDAFERLKNLNMLKTGCIRIGIASYVDFSCIASYILNFHNLFPGVNFEIVNDSTSNMISMLEMRKIDIMVDFASACSKKDISKLSLVKLDSCFCYNRAVYKDICLKKVEDLNKYPLLLPSSVMPVRQKLDDYMMSKNIRLTPVFECESAEIMLEMVLGGLGIGYLANDFISAKKASDVLSVISFDGKLPAVEFSCFYINDFLTTATKKFIEMLAVDK